MNNIEQDAREKYNNSPIYDQSSITHSLHETGESYSQKLLSVKSKITKSYVKSKNILDIGCANGRHLSDLSHIIKYGIGIDFSHRFIDAAISRYGNIANLRFMVADARDIGIASGKMDVIYSLATLYYIDDIFKVYSEISRLLAPAGIAILEVGNSRSLATQVSQRSENSALAQHSVRVISEHKQALKAANLKIVTHRSFQIFPMWGNLDGIWSLLRHPVIDRLMNACVRKRMIDEWISSLPILRNFAFRHIIVCEKPLTATTLVQSEKI